MDLLQNPFSILNACPRDNRRRIMELADERSLLLDSSECMEARSILTNPRKRLSAEISWLPGVSPKTATNAINWISKSVEKLPPKSTLDALTPIVRANLLACAIQHLKNKSKTNIPEWILEIAWAFEDLDPDELRVIINEERVVSGFQKCRTSRPSKQKSKNGGDTIARSSNRPSTTFPQKNSWRQSPL